MNTSNIRRLFAWAGTVAAVLVLLAPAAAIAIENETFGIVPHPHDVNNEERRTFAVPLEPGAVFEDAVRVYNRTDQQLSLIVYAADAETGVDGTISVGFRGSRPKGIGAWIDLSRDSMNIPPHGEALVRFRIEIRSSDPLPDLGAVVVENAERGIATDLAQRLHIVIRTVSPNSATTSVRVRPLLLRSPWVIIATLGLIVALVIVWLGARRARRPKDTVVPAAALRERLEKEQTPASSKPILRRLGETGATAASRRRQTAASRAARASRASKDEDSRPILDDLLTDLAADEQEAAAPPQKKPAKRQPARGGRKPAASRTQRKDRPRDQTGKFIPLDEL